MMSKIKMRIKIKKMIKSRIRSKSRIVGLQSGDFNPDLLLLFLQGLGARTWRVGHD